MENTFQRFSFFYWMVVMVDQNKLDFLHSLLDFLLSAVHFFTSLARDAVE